MKTITIGNATLYLGDCLELLQQGAFDNADALITDPPYGIGYVFGGTKSENCTGRRVRGELVQSSTKPIHGDDKPFDPSPWINAFNFPAERNRPILLFGADHYKTRLPEGGRFVCWDKSCGMGAAASFCDAEFMWTNRKNPRSIVRHLWMGLIRSGEGVSRKGRYRPHPSAKPVEVMAWCLEHCRVGLDKTVLDPYMGSGSTGVACMMTGRKFIGCEIDEEYFDISCKRIEDAQQQIKLCFDDESVLEHTPATIRFT